MKRKFDELISYFNRKVSDMSIDQKYKMELLGMISAIGFAHEEELGTNLASLGTDCISRQAAIDYFVTNVGFHDEDGYPIEDTDELRKIWTEYFSGIPSAEPKRGKWIYCEDSMADCVDGYRCDKCGFFVPWDYKHKGIDFIQDYNFCPNCGADMREVNNESN